ITSIDLSNDERGGILQDGSSVVPSAGARDPHPRGDTVMSSTTASNYATSTSTAQAAASAAPAWDIDSSHSSANFKVRHLMVSHVRGELGPISGAVWIDDQDITRSRIDVSIDARKIATRDEKRDEHLRSADFLDVANHPTVTFKSTRVERAGGDDLRVTGDLTIRGTTRPVTL